MGLLVNNMAVKDVCSSLHHLLKNVVTTKVGVTAREIMLIQSATGKPALEKRENVAIDDRFKLKIPIADQFVTWEVVFNCSYPESPPDFDINDLDFFYNLDTDTAEEQLPSLTNWNTRNDYALINVITELRSAYLKYQVQRLEILDNRCAYEYNTLTSEKIPADQIEVFVDTNVIHMFIKLVVDLPLPPEETADDFKICLLMRFGPLVNGRANSLYTSPNINEVFGTSLELPRNIKNDESLVEYTEEVVRSLEEQIRTVVETREKKRQLFVFELLKHLGRSLISYDALDYLNATFLMEKDGFVCVLEVTLTRQFPVRSPRYRLIATYLATKDGNVFSQVLNIPYNEMWDVKYNAENAINVILLKKIDSFMKIFINSFQRSQL